MHPCRKPSGGRQNKVWNAEDSRCQGHKKNTPAEDMYRIHVSDFYRSLCLRAGRPFCSIELRRVR